MINRYRRNFLIRGLLLGLAPPLKLLAGQSEENGEMPRSSAHPGFAEAFASVRQKTLDYHRDLGYQLVEPKSLLTGDSFNGGLRYDESGTLDDAPDRAMIVQDCARIADIGERERHDILPYFHIFGCQCRNHHDRARIMAETLEFLLGPVGLDPKRLALVSVDGLSNYRDLLAGFGIDWQHQVVIRDAEAARAAGDGSGHFRPKGHPHQPDVVTAGVHTWMGEGPAPSVTSYPLPDRWTEIAEMGLAADSGIVNGIGLERLVYATTGLWPGWEEQRKLLLAQIEAEASASGAALPEGYNLFKQLANSSADS